MSLYITALKNYLANCGKSSLLSADKALVLIPGATSGAEEGFGALTVFRELAINVIPIVSKGALKVYGEENLLSLGGFTSIITEENFDNIDIVKHVRLVYLPVITANLVGKLAQGIYDELLATIIFHALLAGVPVMGTIDGALPDGDDFIRRGYKKPSTGLISLLKRNLEEIAQQDINLYPANEIREKIVKVLGCHSVQAAVKQNTIHTLSKKIITQSDLGGLENSEIAVGEETIITDLAKEYAIKHNIVLKVKI